MRMTKFLGFLLMLAVCNLVTSPPFWTSTLAEETETPILQVHQMMLGCADGYLIRFGDVDILVDGGEPAPQKPLREAVDYLRAAGVDTLDACIITHWHLDHCMNMNPILAEFGGPETVVYGPSAAVPDEIFNGTVTVAIGPVANGVYQQVQMGDVLTFGDLTITFIGPEKLTLNGDCNADSLNFVLQYGERKMLFTGDFGQSQHINGKFKALCTDVDVLKFPHHGIEPFELGTIAARTVSPEVVLVPGVASKFKVWDFFDDKGVKFPRENVLTNADGHVVILTDGAAYFEVLTQQTPADYARETV